MTSEAPTDRRVLCLVDVGTRVDELALRVGERLATALRARLDAQPAPRRWAVEWPADADRALVVIASAAPSAVASLWQVARSPTLATRLRVPAVLIPREAAAADTRWSGELVCGVDRSRGARSAARVASRLAARLEVPLALVHAREPAPAVALGPGGVAGAAGLVPDDMEESRDAAWELLDAIDRITPERARLRLRRGRPAACLNDYAAQQGAPLIVVGAPEHGRLSALLLGSTAWELSRHASTPVMYVPSGAS
jgi:nucleotide-binding universal stress UspA family protein